MQRAEQSIRVAAPANQVYQFWRNFENFPRFMEHVEEVRLLDGDGTLSHWKLKGPLGTKPEFDARLTRDDKDQQIAWNSTEGSMQTSGAVTFSPLEGDAFTEVHVVMQWYDVPGGVVGEALAQLLQNPEHMLKDDLQRFKELVEMQGNASAPGASGSRPQQTAGTA
jgi:uncharacterized membrane protein